MDGREGIEDIRDRQDIDDADKSCPLWVICTIYIREDARLDGYCVHMEGCERYETMQERGDEGLAFHWTPKNGKLRI